MSDPERKDVAPTRAVAFECDLPEPPEKVWRALTTPEIVAEWLGPGDFRPEPGAGFGFRDRAAGAIEGEVLAVEAWRSISLGWRDEAARRDGLDSTVTFEIAPAGTGTHLRILHEVRHAASQPASTAMLRARKAVAANDNRTIMRLAA
jgi:uncharacterized protein YndB with AHSA1/START domain